MEMQWPLILFTTFVAWSGGLFGMQGVAALAGEGKRAQMPALLTSVVLLVVGGIAVFFHLQHWERIFNGFGNPTSGITQELVCIVVVAVLMVVAFALLRRADKADDAVFPKWFSMCLVAASALLVAVTGHSYMMEARPAWNSWLGPLSLLGVACAAGPFTFVVIETLRDDAAGRGVSVGALAGAAVNAALTVGYLVFMQFSTGAYTNVGYAFDSTHPNAGLVDAMAFAPFSDGCAALAVVAVLAALVAVVAAFAARRGGNWKAWGAVGMLGAVASAVTLRMVFYSVGGSMFLLF